MSLESFFNPKSVAIVGASRQKSKVGYEILANMIGAGYKGKIFPVNPQADTIEGLQCYPDLQSIEQVPELVVIIVPAKIVSVVMQQCVKVGTRAVIIITAGFKEVGKEGRELEEQIVQIARQAGIRIIGPNCLGVIAPANNLNASFGGALPAAGATGYLSQSGALLAAILDMANANGIGFSKLVSIGNKADVDELDIIKALGEDRDTKVIAGYLESITDGNAFVSQAERISHNKPILLMKSGGTAAGAKAASSHTGSLAGSETAYECVFERAGIIRCDSIKEQFDYAQAFANQPLPSFAKLTDETVNKLASELPAAANLYNPIDVLGDALADRYEFALDVVLDDPNVDTILVLLTPQAMTESAVTAESVVKVARRKPAKPILACFLGAGKVEEGVRILRDGRIPVMDCPESAVATIKVMADYVRWRSRPKRIVKLFPVNRRKVEGIVERHLRQGIRDMLDILHKSDVGGVKVGLNSEQEVKDAFDLMMYRIPKKRPEANILGVLVQEMCKSGKEVILGMNRDPHFGPLMMFGMGGIMVEVLKDVSFYLAPLTAEEAKQMLINTKTYQMLKGVRGEEGVDIKAIAEGLQRLSQLVTEFPHIQEMDINPYIVGPEGTTPIAVDARMSIEK